MKPIIKEYFDTFLRNLCLLILLAINFRLRYNPVDGNDLYLVYNEILNNNPRSRIPMLPSSEARALMVKYIHTFRL